MQPGSCDPSVLRTSQRVMQPAHPNLVSSIYRRRGISAQQFAAVVCWTRRHKTRPLFAWELPSFNHPRRQQSESSSLGPSVRFPPAPSAPEHAGSFAADFGHALHRKVFTQRERMVSHGRNKNSATKQEQCSRSLRRAACETPLRAR